MIRIVAKLFAVTIILTAFFNVGPPLAAAPLTFVASNGSDANPCTAAQPCATLTQAFNSIVSGGQVICLNPTGFPISETTFGSASFSLTIDCAGTVVPQAGFGVAFTAANQVFKIRNLTFDGTLASAGPAISVTGSGTLILENCVFENLTGVALDIEPTGALNLVITNSRISNNTAGVLIKPASGGSVTATFDGVTIADNTGGGVKTDTTNGAINLAISNSTISKNAGNGLNAVGGAFGAFGDNILELVHDVIASNGTAGVQANGTSAAVLVNNTSILNNATGATSIVAGGRILTYGNNSIVGTLGSGFTSSTPLQ
jgi:hypothetical protein